MSTDYPLLDHIEFPADLRKLPKSQLKPLADEVRQYLLRTVARCGGHLGAGLGTVELTIALHYVFNTPDDRIVWDVGHQSYPHKILTGRKDRLVTIRQKGGLAPFPKREESEYDTFGVGHAGTSISAAVGMAAGTRNHVVAVIGDGALTSGMAYEAMNHAGHLNSNVLVILNDNEMSISPNVGALTNYLARCVSSPIYSSLREGGKTVLKQLPPLAEFARRAEEHVKGMVAPGTLFEELGFHYFGPIDGHDLGMLTKMLRNLSNLKGPRLLHIKTTKGKGYAPAEADRIKYHGVSPFDPELGIQKSSSSGPAKPSYTQVFGDWLCDMAALDQRLIGITPAMREGSGLVRFEKEYPDRYHDVAIAEQHSVTIAAGMACEGLKPVVAIYSTFLQRGYDQMIHDVAVQNLPVLFALDRAGVVGPDGPTHAGAFDISFMRCIPNMVVMTPADENETRQMLYTGFQLDQPASVRYPRGTGPGVEVRKEMTALPLGKAEIRRKGKEIAILAFGVMLEPALKAADALGATVVNMRFVKPIDGDIIVRMAAAHRMLVTVEDNVVMGGAGSAVSECLAAEGVAAHVLHLGWPDRNIEHASREEMLEECGLDADGIQRSIERFRQRLFGEQASSRTPALASV